MPEIQVKGMSCDHCRKSVTEAVANVPGVKDVQVDLASGKASWQDADAASPVPVDAVKKAVNAIGFEAS